mgnify:CR=1 FL=1
MFGYNKYVKNRTSSRLDEIFKNYHPNKWIFGHHHRSMQNIINNTLFICLTELEIVKII